jgi:hypothetical protein
MQHDDARIRRCHQLLAGDALALSSHEEVIDERYAMARAQR